METMETTDKGNKQEKNYFALGEVFSYFFRKKDAERKPDFNLRMMHGINKLSILVFLAALVLWIVRRLI